MYWKMGFEEERAVRGETGEEVGGKTAQIMSCQLRQKQELYDFIMSPILRKCKCNDDKEASLMRLRHQFTLNLTTFSRANY